MLQRAAPNSGIRIAEGSKLVFLVLKQVRVDRTGENSVVIGKLPDVVCAAYSIRAVPTDMQRYGRAHSSEQMYLPSVAKLLLSSGGCGWLNEFSESCACIGEAPGWKLDAEGLERIKNFFSFVCVHTGPQSTDSKSTILALTRSRISFGERAVSHCRTVSITLRRVKRVRGRDIESAE